jgi:hypothetical protein
VQVLVPTHPALAHVRANPPPEIVPVQVRALVQALGPAKETLRTSSICPVAAIAPQPRAPARLLVVARLPISCKIDRLLRVNFPLDLQQALDRQSEIVLLQASFRLDQEPQAGRLLEIVKITSKTSVITFLIVEIIAPIPRKIVARSSPTITLDELITDNNGRITASQDVTTCTII